MYILHNWKIVHRTNSSGRDSICIGGKVYGSSRFTSGEPITTSSLVGYRIDGAATIVATRNGSEYMLGKASASELFAKQRLIRLLQESAGGGDAAPDNITQRRSGGRLGEHSRADESAARPAEARSEPPQFVLAD